MEVVGYSYDAAVHCVDCTEEYVKKHNRLDGHVPNADDMDAFRSGEWEVLDSENNPIHAIFDTDEGGDTPEHCDDCHEMIDVSWTGEAVSYAINALWDYVHESVAGGHTGDPEVLDKWDEAMSYHIGLSQQEELIRELYVTTRKFEGE
jgi:hypothetical protein